MINWIWEVKMKRESEMILRLLANTTQYIVTPFTEMWKQAELEEDSQAGLGIWDLECYLDTKGAVR